MNVVTSFSPRGWTIYGWRFVDSFLQHWPDSVRLHVFLEGQEVPRGYPQVIWHDLKRDHEHEAFCEKWKDPKWNDPRDFNAQSVKFCHKVFAITSPDLPKEGWRIWVDADVMWTNKVTQKHLDIIAPNDKELTFLGRTGWMRPGQVAYTECGFVGYNLSSLITQSVLDEMRSTYTSGKLFTLGLHNWHDSYVFDYCRLRQTTAIHWNNLSEHVQGAHVWPETVLAQFSTHNKGPRRKSAAYGGSV